MLPQLPGNRPFETSDKPGQRLSTAQGVDTPQRTEQKEQDKPDHQINNK
ncbi:hypothetical protein AXFE_02870 [Acidithrix ferrooxidans]|uniref:Uncharacterized protein n=1 Tax=Acidithrix ferrooxidans TaxID=1280514 RepID=A0A0D8HLM4_9ACTN|nr:hypothetical protein AXFE_35370 [Acidithrix ferrooxidans]KJF18880.1 hypothetical protein AXFE_02870 [Acidithrix ferrooxidans]CAG4921397.1 unnamed protein product [Acidithrix sp. C25]CAG4928540.1 unnamed protein product [Acidithrix sp. C25]